ncbi:NAD(+) diphosphatase [Hirschia baltica]|uniref:NAD(+) diphosphatase n=1 Tax=Hirschia baltica (strain ATCC 49814 / DSM 5838 / IFAM 1418) TaxID=582402 RepID=C6XQ36_HIRBI|nr:NAD(+) diphosphatase [Hirschia baltica]ACT58553.1 NUDIX hydrolase [Hirschia baltica ATCC 49814]
MLLNPTITFANAPFERSAHRRTDTDWLEQAKKSPDTRFLPFYNGKILCIDNGIPAHEVIPGIPISKEPRKIAWLFSDEIPHFNHCKFIFLSEENGVARFGVLIPPSFQIETSILSDLVLGELRAISGGISAEDAQYVSTCAAVFNWHRRHRFCSNCGTETQISEAGWKRVCDACEAEHFPRIDPVAIMLAVKGDKCLMGRQASWHPSMYSCLAGFVEPGETIAQAGARELFEEAGVVASGRIEYLFEQPWPFPSSLMIGMIMEVQSEELNIDKTEIETARWFTKEEARQILQGEHPDISAPTDIAIAHHILKAWAYSETW